MGWIGREPAIGNYQVCDALTASATATYALAVGGVSVSPESANHVICSLNGVIQKPVSSFTISGSNIVFASALTSSDSIDFIMLLGSTLDVGIPSDASITNAKLASDVISGETDIGGAIADADLFLIDDGAGGTLRKTAASRIKTYVGGISNTPAFAVTLSGHQSLSNETSTKVTWDTEQVDTDSAFASNKFTVPSGKGGNYLISYQIYFDSGQNSNHDYSFAIIKKNGSDTIDEPIVDTRGNPGRFFSYGTSRIIALSASDYLEIYGYHSAAISGSGVQMRGGINRSYFCGFKID